MESATTTAGLHGYRIATAAGKLCGCFSFYLNWITREMIITIREQKAKSSVHVTIGISPFQESGAVVPLCTGDRFRCGGHADYTI